MDTHDIWILHCAVGIQSLIRRLAEQGIQENNIEGLGTAKMQFFCMAPHPGPTMESPVLATSALQQPIFLLDVHLQPRNCDVSLR